MEVETESKPLPPPPANLAAVLEHAALMAKQLPSAADPSQLLQIHAALHTAHHRLSLFLSRHHPPPPPIPENSVSAVGGSEEDGEPMQMEDEEEEEQISRAATTASAELRRSNDDESERVSVAAAAAEDFDPFATKLRSLDLIYQFHA